MIGRAATRHLTDVGLLELMRAEFTWAKSFLTAEFMLLGLGVVFGALGVFISAWTESFAVLTVILACLAYFSRWFFERYHAFAEQVRRALALEDGLGIPIDADSEMRFRSQFCHWANYRTVRSKPNTSRYFASDLPPGQGRVLANLRESIFWQSNLARYASAYSLYALVVVVLLAAVTAYVGMASLEDHPTQIAVAKTFLVLVIFGVTGGLLKLWLDHAKQAEELDVLDTAAKSLVDHPGSATDLDVVRLVQEYNSLVSLGPAVPDFVYDWNESKLNELYDNWKRKKTTTPVSPTP